MRNKLSPMKYKIGDIVVFMVEGDKKPGEIYVADYGGSLFSENHSYDIFVESDNGMLYKHIVETDIVLKIREEQHD